MPKADIDALVMHLLDQHGLNGSGPLSIRSNQTVSELIKTPVTKVKKLRYDAALKFGDRIEDQAMGRLLAALSRASIETEGDKICLIIEDSLAKNWLQGKLKTHQHIFDHSFNTEIVKVNALGLFQVLRDVFDKDELDIFNENYKKTKEKTNFEERKKFFTKIVKQFAEGAAKQAGSGVVAVLKANLGIP
jgi:hypothetical protein